MERGVVLNPQRFELWKTRFEFMSHIIGAHGIRPSPERLRAVVEMPNPTDVSSTRKLLGLPGKVCSTSHDCGQTDSTAGEPGRCLELRPMNRKLLHSK